jgi:4-hydroxymandelate oxidase
MGTSQFHTSTNMPEQQKIRTPLDYIPAEIACAQDYAAIAHHFIAPDRLAYIAGGSGQDVTLKHNAQALQQFAIRPSVFANTANASTQIDVLQQTFKHPLFLAPVAYQTLVHPQGELASAEAAAATDTCMIPSTLSSYTLEQIAQKAGEARWFQLYLQANPKDTEKLIQHAQTSGYQALVLTADAAVQMPSMRALRAGFRFPQEVRAANLKDMQAASATSGSSIFQAYQQNALTAEKLQQVMAQTDLPVIVKGVLNPEDASQLQHMGVAGIVVSNHGGRTLDGVPASLLVLPAIRERVGADYPVLFDGGIRSGSDVFKAIALGADAVLIGRLQVYALAVAGALGVAHMLKLMCEELELSMATAGCASIADIKNAQLYRY